MKPGAPGGRGATVATTLTAGAALVVAGGWCLLMLFATAIGTKAPTAAEMFALVWPALGGGVLALAALAMRRRAPVVPILLACAGLVTVIAGIWIITA